MGYLLVFLLELLLVCGVILLTTTSGNPAVRLNSDKVNVTSKRTVQQYHSAMGQILAANSHRRNNLNYKNIKRMNITGHNESADEGILLANKEERIADDLFEGDVVLDPLDSDDLQLIKLKEENKNGLSEKAIRRRQAVRQMKRLWHSRVVPYMIGDDLAGIRNLIEQTIVKFNQQSCLQFAPRRGNERDYVIFKKNDGCFSRIGRSYTTPGYQVISIGQFCDSEPIIIHEMLHAVGFYHEQSRPDRNQYLEIIWENIDPQYQDQFLRYSHGEIDKFGISYNYKSIMHYPRTAFSQNTERNSMQAIGNPTMELGNTQMSSEDVLELNTLYDCKTNTYNSWTSWSSYGPCDSTCNKKRQRYCYGSTPGSCGGETNEYGIEDQWIKCGANECPIRVDGNWGRWTSWEDCSVNCNEGVQTRTRTCNDPIPSNGGAACPNSARDYKMCSKERCTLGMYDTDFRNGVIGQVWRNDVYDTPGFDWSIGQGSTATEGTGPPSDHSTGQGYYLFIESTGRSSRDNARLISVVMPATGGNKKCLKFFYHMFGPTTGSLSVNMYPESQNPKPLFWMNGNKENKWKPANVTLYSAVHFQLVVEAVVAGPTYSDIAIDDVFIDEGDCDCQDVYRSCAKWAATGDCAHSYLFMVNFCPRTCEYCGCRDTFERCSTWGRTECRANPTYMNVLCPLTCRVCRCHDNNIRCVKWAKNGECTRNVPYMSKNCRKSCGLCT